MAKPLILKVRVDDKGNAVLDDLTNNMKKASKQALSTGKVFKAMLASSLVQKAIEGTTLALKALVVEGLVFQDTFKKVEGVTGIAGDQLERLKDVALAASNGSEFLASEVAKATLQISKMGFTVDQSIATIPEIMDLATAGVTTLAEAGELTVQTLKSFGLEAGETNRVVNAIFTTISKTAIGFDDFKEAMKFIAPIAEKMNLSLEETSALIGVLGDVGLKGSVGGTALKNILLNIIEPSKETAKTIKGLNLEGKSLAEILSLLKDQFGEETLQKFMETFNLRALAGSLAISGMSDETQKLIKTMQEQVGITKKAADYVFYRAPLLMYRLSWFACLRKWMLRIL